MKILAATRSDKLLVEMSTEELNEVTNWKGPWNGSQYIENLQVGGVVDLKREFRDAKELLTSFRGIAPALVQSAKRLENLAAQVELHEPDVSLLPKKES